jgi:tubulin beta
MQISNVVVEPYNAVLTLHHLIDDVDMCHVLDNQALYSIATNVLRIRNPTNAHLNRLGWLPADYFTDQLLIAIHTL